MFSSVHRDPCRTAGRRRCPCHSRSFSTSLPTVGTRSIYRRASRTVLRIQLQPPDKTKNIVVIRQLLSSPLVDNTVALPVVFWMWTMWKKRKRQYTSYLPSLRNQHLTLSFRYCQTLQSNHFIDSLYLQQMN
ncbi:hypothetical protein BDW22DRAFT_813802 [Trametopsis cervina]|nr:hypothetical protein BDW22DRAFT_813802 [Trametopsis cervina]